MNDEKFRTYLSGRFEQARAYQGSRASVNKLLYAASQVVIIIGSALAPVAVALTDSKAIELGIGLPIVLSAAVALAAGLQSAFAYQHNWIRYRTAAKALKRMRIYWDSRLAPFDAEHENERRRKFVIEVERLLEDETKSWADQFTPDDENA